jgi:hypothetical protein
MLNARTLAQTTSMGDTSGADAPSESLRPVEAFRTKEGVIVLSNRPAGDQPVQALDSQAPARSPVPALSPVPARGPVPVRSPAPPAAQPAAPARAPLSVQQEPARDDAAGANLWLLLAALALAVAAVALVLSRRKRRRITAHHAALLAGSEPISPVADEHVGPFARRRNAPSTLTPLPSSLGNGTSRASVVPGAADTTPLPASSARDEPSGICAPPASERQWLSQPPPRSYKQPPS